MRVGNKIRLHLFLFNLRYVSLALLPASVTLDTDVLTLLEIFCTVAFPFMKETIIAGFIDAAGVLSLRCELHLQLLDVGFNLL